MQYAAVLLVRQRDRAVQLVPAIGREAAQLVAHADRRVAARGVRRAITFYGDAQVVEVHAHLAEDLHDVGCSATRKGEQQGLHRRNRDFAIAICRRLDPAWRATLEHQTRVLPIELNRRVGHQAPSRGPDGLTPFWSSVSVWRA